MIRSPFHAAAGLTVIAGTLSVAQISRADDVTVVAPEPAPVVVVRPATDTVQTRTESNGPDTRKIGGGIVTFGISYGVAVVVAATSDHQGDNHLYVPIVGPWLDFGDRGRCPQNGSCNPEIGNRVLIAVDGVFQAIGVLGVASGFLFPRTHEVTTTTTAAATQATVQITPVEYPHGGLGLAAVGRF
jgi:hypothetical protein